MLKLRISDFGSPFLWGECFVVASLWLVLALALLVGLAAVPARGVDAGVNFSGVVSGNVSNDSLMLFLPGAGNFSFVLSNASQTFSLQFAEFENVTLFNVSVAPDNFSCEVVLRDAIVNATAYFENITRYSLVPNVEQYNGLLALRQNDTAACVVAQNILSNVIAARDVELNNSRINFDYMVLAKDAELSKERSEKGTSNIVVVVLAVMFFVLLLMLLTGRTPKQWLMEFIDQTPGGTAPSGLKVPKGGKVVEVVESSEVVRERDGKGRFAK